MMSAQEKEDAKTVINSLDDILNLTHRLRLFFNEHTETVEVFTLSDPFDAEPLRVINVQDDSARGVLEDVMRVINEL